jgi:hypothetical protein
LAGGGTAQAGRGPYQSIRVSLYTSKENLHTLIEVPTEACGIFEESQMDALDKIFYDELTWPEINLAAEAREAVAKPRQAMRSGVQRSVCACLTRCWIEAWRHEAEGHPKTGAGRQAIIATSGGGVAGRSRPKLATLCQPKKEASPRRQVDNRVDTEKSG